MSAVERRGLGEKSSLLPSMGLNEGIAVFAVGAVITLWECARHERFEADKQKRQSPKKGFAANNNQRTISGKRAPPEDARLIPLLFGISTTHVGIRTIRSALDQDENLSQKIPTVCPDENLSQKIPTVLDENLSQEVQVKRPKLTDHLRNCALNTFGKWNGLSLKDKTDPDSFGFSDVHPLASVEKTSWKRC